MQNITAELKTHRKKAKLNVNSIEDANPKAAYDKKSNNEDQIK